MSAWTSPPLPAIWSGATHSAFVGRSRELAILESAWIAAENGTRQAVFIGGEPGAGKSRLLTEVCRELERLGAAVLVGTSVAELGPPYQPFDEPVVTLRTALLDATLTVGDGAENDDAGARLGTLVGQGRADGSRPDPYERRDTFEALVRTLRAAARERPTVLALEDLHWSGPAAQQLLTYVVERTASSRLLILGTHRTTAPDRSSDLVLQIALLYRLGGVQRLDLEPLHTEDIADYLVVEGGVPRSQARSVAVVLRDRTGGNPFFLRELWLDIARGGSVRESQLRDQPAPEVVRDMVAHRLARLGPDQRMMLETAAVIGEEVDVATLAATLARGSALASIDETVAAGLLQPVAGATDRWRFVHALTRQAVLDLMSAQQLARAHERVAVALEARGGAIQRLAHHYSSAHALGHADKAVHYLDEAGRVADRGLAHADAASLYVRAAELSAEPYDRDARLLAAARSALLACDFSGSRAMYLRVATEGDVRHRLEAAIAYEESAWFSARSGQFALDVLVTALEADPPARDDPRYVRALAGKGRATALTGQHDRAEHMLAEAISLARDRNDAELLGDALSASMQVGVGPSGRALKMARARELCEVATTTGQWLHLGPAAYHRAVIAYTEGNAVELATARRAMERAADASGQKYWSYLAGCADYGTQFIAGDFPAAARSCEALLELATSFGDDSADGPFGVQSFMVRRETGAVEQVRGLVTGLETAGEHWAPALLALFTELGLAVPAGRLLHHVVQHDLSVGSGEARWPATLAFACEAACALEDRAVAARLRPHLDEYAGLNLVMGPFVALFGAADRYAAELDSLLGVGDPDATYATALELERRSNATLHEAHTLASWSHHARRAGDTARAASLAKRARGLAEPRGMSRVMLRLERPTLVARQGSRGPDGLTGRETEVLRLLAEGCSNRDLARRLVISENTAANHVRNILIKTGCTNRTQAAMYASERGLLA